MGDFLGIPSHYYDDDQVNYWGGGFRSDAANMSHNHYRHRPCDYYCPLHGYTQAIIYERPRQEVTHYHQHSGTRFSNRNYDEGIISTMFNEMAIDNMTDVRQHLDHKRRVYNEHVVDRERVFESDKRAKEEAYKNHKRRKNKAFSLYKILYGD